MGVSVHAVVTGSRANGPGARTVVWFQGCPLACPGCFNQETHVSGEDLVDISVLVDDLLARDAHPSGLTVSGGEPLAQPVALGELIALWNSRSGTSVIVSTGFEWAEIESDPLRAAGIKNADVVIAGRYNSRLHLGSTLRGSSNKTYHFLTDFFQINELIDVPEFEVVISPDGTVHVSGVAGSQPLADLLGFGS